MEKPLEKYSADIMHEFYANWPTKVIYGDGSMRSYW